MKTEKLIEMILEHTHEDGHEIFELFHMALAKAGFDALANFIAPLYDDINVFGLENEPDPFILQRTHWYEGKNGQPVIDNEQMTDEFNYKINNLGVEK